MRYRINGRVTYEINECVYCYDIGGIEKGKMHVRVQQEHEKKKRNLSTVRGRQNGANQRAVFYIRW